LVLLEDKTISALEETPPMDLVGRLVEAEAMVVMVEIIPSLQEVVKAATIAEEILLQTKAITMVAQVTKVMVVVQAIKIMADKVEITELAKAVSRVITSLLCSSI